MIPYRLLLLLAEDEVGLVGEGEVASPVTLVGQWSRIIQAHSPNERIELTSPNKRIN